MGDILVTSIWNRIMITHFELPAAPVGLLIALRYFLAPLSVWAGFRSDSSVLFGTRRTAYIWVGRALMLLSLPLLGWSLEQFAVSAHELGWALALGASLLYGVGTLLSGSPFLALVRDAAPPERQGLAVSMTQTALIIFFAAVGILFGLLMESYSVALFWRLVAITAAVGGAFWFLAIVGVEGEVYREAGTTAWAEAERATETADDAAKPDIMGSLAHTVREAWSDQRTRSFFLFLSLATLGGWMQDAILEPFGAEVFDLSVGRTTRFNSFWQGATVLTLVSTSILFRARRPERQAVPTGVGLAAMAVGLVVLSTSVLAERAVLIEAGLVVFGAGFGVYTFGGLSLMAVMVRDRHAGTYLGFWTIAAVVFKGVGTFVGAALRDWFLAGLGMEGGAAYASIFLLEACALALAAGLLWRVDVPGFAADVGRLATTERSTDR
jgi:BCD family chlorophyll transporter-like MFS transporter